MARRYQKRYEEYRGRRGKGSPVLKIIIALLALVLAAGLVFVFLLNGRVEFTDDGVRFILPWTQADPSPAPSQTPGTPSPPVIVVTDEPTPEPTQPVRTLETIAGVEVTAAQLADGTAAGVVTAAGGNALVVEMKDEYGRLQWRSGAALAATLGMNAGSDAVAQAVSALAEGGELYLVARVTCFRDQALAAAQVGGPLMTRGGNIWYDRQGLRWVSPTSETVTAYLTQLCVELADMGFDEILLDCAGYPDLGETHVLATSQLRPEDLTVPVAAFCAQVSAALTESQARLGVLTTAAALLGQDAYSGLTAQTLAQSARRVWLEPTTLAADCAAALEGVGMEDVAAGLVRVGSQTQDGSWASIQTFRR